MTASEKRYAMNDGNSIPAIGLGLWRVTDDEAERIVCEGVAVGYRSLDTASLYLNETGVGRGVRACGVPRDQLFVATKVWNNCHGYDKTLRAFDESMKRLGLEYLDLYLIHWPVANSELYLDSWQAFLKLREEGRVRSIGVSNFLARHMRRLVEVSGVAPAVNQIECHPYFQQREVIAAARELGVLVEAWAPLGRAKPLAEPAVAALARKYGKTPAQIVLRWHLDRGLAAIPKSVHQERMRENFNVFDFALEPDEIVAIDAISNVFRIGDDPETFVDKKDA